MKTPGLEAVSLLVNPTQSGGDLSQKSPRDVGGRTEPCGAPGRNSSGLSPSAPVATAPLREKGVSRKWALQHAAQADIVGDGTEHHQGVHEGEGRGPSSSCNSTSFPLKQEPPILTFQEFELRDCSRLNVQSSFLEGLICKKTKKTPPPTISPDLL